MLKIGFIYLYIHSQVLTAGVQDVFYLAKAKVS